MALGRHEEAAEVAVGLARRAQEAGNYKACTDSSYSHHASQQLPMFHQEYLPYLNSCLLLQPGGNNAATALMG